MYSCKKFVAVFLSALMLLSLLPFSVLGEELNDGQEDSNVNPDFTISTVEELLAFAQEVNSGNNFKGQTIVLAADLDLSGYEWEAIGNGQEMVLSTEDEIPAIPYNHFAGDFDGQQYTVSGIECYGKDLGFFGIVTGTVKNLTVKDSIFGGNGLSAAIVFYLQTGVVENCRSIDNIISGELSVGGLVAQTTSSSVVSNCVNKSMVYGDGAVVGCVVGTANNSTIIGCANYADVKDTSYSLGGIVGEANECVIEDCINYGNLSAYEVAGGIVDSVVCSVIKNCANLGSVTAEYVAGGIVAEAKSVYDGPTILSGGEGTEFGEDDARIEKAVIENCYNGGRIHLGDLYFHGGGIAGYLSGEIYNCYNKGEIFADEMGDNYLGGIVGFMDDGSISESVNMGKVISDNGYAGGIVAYISVSEASEEALPITDYIDNCYYHAESAENGASYYWVGVFNEIDGWSSLEGEFGDMQIAVAVDEADLRNQEIYRGLDFNEIWEIGPQNAQLQCFNKLYRVYMPAEKEDDSIVLDGRAIILGIELQDGEYLANGSDEPTTETPDVGYAYFKNGKLYLNNFYYSGTGAVYGVTPYVILTYGSVEIVLVGESTVELIDSGYSTAFAIAHAPENGGEEFTVIYSGNGTLNVNSDFVALQCFNNLLIKGGTFNIASKEQSVVSNNLEVVDGEFNIETIGEYAVYIYDECIIRDGEFNILSEYSGIHAENVLQIENGVFNVEAYEDALYADEMLLIKDGEFTLYAEYALVSYYDVVIFGGKFKIGAYRGIYTDYYDIYIYGGDFVIGACYGIDSCEDVYIENASITIDDADCAISSCCSDDIIIKNSKVEILYSYEGLYSDSNVDIINSKVYIESDYAIISDGNVCIEDSNVEIESRNAIYTYNGNIEITNSKADIYASIAFDAIGFDVYVTDSVLYAEAEDCVFKTDNVIFTGGKTNVIDSACVFDCYEVYFNSGNHSFKGDNVSNNINNNPVYFELTSDTLTEEWAYDGDGYLEWLLITDEADLGQVAPEELPKEDEEAVEDEAYIYVGGVELSDGKYLPNGASFVTDVQPQKGGYAYYKDGVLTLNNYKYYGEGYKFPVNTAFYVYSVILSQTDLEIVLLGENVLSNTVSVSDGITAFGNLSIGGEGSLEIVAYEGIYSYGDNLSINANVTIDAENIGITVNELYVDGGKLSALGTSAFDTAKVVLGENMEYTTGDENSAQVVIEYVEEIIPDESEDSSVEESTSEDSSAEDESSNEEPSEDESSDDSSDDSVEDNSSKDESSDETTEDTSSDDTSSDDTSEDESETGDINGNGKIDMTDYILLKRAYFGTFTFNDAQNKAGDINGNGKIDMTDYILLKRIYFGTYTLKK